MSEKRVAEEEGRSEPVIVMLLPAEGDFARVGSQLFQAAELAASELNVDVEWVDEGQEPADTMAAMSALAERDDVAAVIGPLGSRRAVVAAQKAQQFGIPLVVYSGTSGIEHAGSWVFRARPDELERGQRLARYLVRERGVGTLAMMGPATQRGERRLRAMIEAFQEEGGEVRALSLYPPDTTHFGPYLDVLVGKRAIIGRGRAVDGRGSDQAGMIEVRENPQVDFEALLIDDHDEVVARLLPFLPRHGLQTGAGGAGVDVELYGFSGWKGEGLRHAGDHALGAIFFDTFGGQIEGGQAEDFAYRFEERWQRMPTTAEAEIYDLVGMIGSGIQAIQPGESWAEAALSRLRTPQMYPGVAGSWSFTESGAPVRYLRPFRVIEGGRWAPMAENRQ